MKSIVLALAITAASDPHSLGVGLDVLPEAFATAAARVNLVADLKQPRCSLAGCRWDFGDGVTIDARVSGEGLGIDRLQAMRVVAIGTAAVRYQKACLAIVALVQPDSAPGERIATADAIASGVATSLASEQPGIRFFGGLGPRADGSAEMRCGVTVDALLDP